jgi:pilus assembly protein CpaB
MDRQKVLMIFGGAFVAALVLSFLLFRLTVAPKTEETISVYAAVRDMAAGTRLKKGDLKLVRVLKRDASPSAITDDKALIDRPLLFPVTTNEPITPSKVAGSAGAEGIPSTIEIGKRALAVQVNDPSGVAGLIQPRAHVDVLFTRPGSMTESVTTTILEDVIVLSITRITEATSSATAATGTTATTVTPAQTNQNRSVTLLVDPDQLRTLELAKQQGRISLALRNPLDTGKSKEVRATSGTILYGDLPKELRPDIKKQQQASGPPPVKIVAAPKPEPPPAPPKPKNVVEVFRGDKHSVEKF